MNIYMKNITLVLLTGLLCLPVYGCNDSQTPLYDPNYSTQGNTSAADFSDITTLPTEPENITPLKQIVQDISGVFIQNGNTPPELALHCFTEETDASGTLTEIDKNQLPMKDGTLQVGLNLLVYSPTEVDYKVKGTFVLFWNGQAYDFSVDGRQSTDGALQLEIPYNQEMVFPFEAENLPVQKGDNTLYFCFIPYCEETGLYLTPQRYYAYFSAEQPLEGREPIAVTDEKELPQERIEVVTDRAAAGTYNSVEQADVIHSRNGSYTLRPNPTFYLNISNVINPEVTSNRSGIGMFFADGELQPIWNGQKYLSAALTADEFRKTIAAETSYQSGEKHNICMLYAELEDDQNFDGEPFSYAELSYCTIEE